MELANPVTVWLCVGIILMLSEIIIPGGIVILLGASCVVVSAAVGLGVVEGFVQTMTLWFITSMVMLLSFRHITQQLVGGDSHVDNTDEEVDLYNQLAIVKEDIGPGQQTGRIHCLGSDWTALGDGSEIKIGTKVRIICRENIGFVVEPVVD